MGRKKQFDTKKLIRMNDILLNEIDNWRAAQADNPDQSEAIRRLIRLGLKSKGSA